ncbi:MAG: hypothetical protein QOJ29_4306, partial [Thermoleophilaceae bacterium]|nr:hypothetical protein [Thermoleophilaceae bacterium]
RRVALQRFHELVQPQRPEAIAHAIEQLRTWAGSSPSDVPRLMTADELGALSQSGVAIGAHTRRHVNLAHQDPEVVRAEIEGSRADVATWTGADPVGFAYPFGLPRHDVSRMARDTVAQAGFSYAVVNQPTAVAGGHDPYTLPRLFAPDLGADAFRAWLG